MLKKSKSLTFFFILSLLTFIIGVLLADNKLKWIIDTTGYETAIALGSVVLWSIFFIMWFLPLVLGAEERHKKEVEKGNVPIFESNCTHISGLASFTAEGKIRIYVDRIHFTVAGTHYELPIERIINMGISTTSHTEYDLKAHPMRGVIGGLLLGEFGLLWGAEHELVKTETKEYFLVIAYSKDEATKFITLGNVDCKKIISTVSKYVDFQEQNVQL